MDANKIVEILRATLDPNLQKEAEKQLEEFQKIIHFTPVLLQVVMSTAVDMPVRQAGVIYLKNMVTRFWTDTKHENPSDPVPFSIHEDDRKPIRDNIIEAIISSPDPVSVQLCVCLSHVIKSDFPGRWPDAVPKMTMYLQDSDHGKWFGALLAVCQLVKVYEYKRSEERSTMDGAMKFILPLLHQRMVQLMSDSSDQSLLLQKLILKILHAFVMNHLPMEVMTREIFTQWMEVMRQVVEKEVPQQAMYTEVEEDERCRLPCWRVKKWAMHFLARVFERYGSPGSTTKEYTDFSEWYLKTFSAGVFQAIFNIMNQYRQKAYVPPRVLQQGLIYINEGVGHALAWKLIKNNMMSLIQDVVFPLMSYSDDDDQLWNNDPNEYIRIKYDVFEDFLSPVMAAQTMFHTATAKRKEVLNKAMGFCMSVLTNQRADPRQKDGALHMISSVANILLKRKIFKDQAELMLTEHVFKEFSSPYGFLRARACWMLRYFSELKFRGRGNLEKMVDAIRTCLLCDEDLPVKVEAALALQMLIADQEKVKECLKPYVKEVVLELLKVIRDSQNDELTTVMQRLVCAYVEEVMPLAVQLTSHLADTFSMVIDADVQGAEEKAITALGILNTMETVLSVMEERKEIILQLEVIVLRVIGIIFRQNIIDFYEEALSLICTLTIGQVTGSMWDILPMVYEMFKKDGIDYFTDMMPALHNYVTVDSDAFLSDVQRMEMLFDMCKTVLTSDVGEDAEVHAAKLMEVVLLQCGGKVDPVLPSLVELALQRLTREVATPELRTMCLQVVIAGLYTRPHLLIDTLHRMRLPTVGGSILEQFLNQWLHDAEFFMGLHDRKLSVLGLCSLLSMTNTRPQEVTAAAAQVLPSILVTFHGLNRAYASRTENERESDDDEDDVGDGDVDPEVDVLASDEDDIDEEGQQYLEKLAKADDLDDSSDLDDDDDGLDETQMESYNTPLDDDRCPVDEYVAFKEILSNLSAVDNSWYTALTCGLTRQQLTQIEEIFRLADLRKAASESRKIERGGGYHFTQRTVPTTFNFAN